MYEIGWGRSAMTLQPRGYAMMGYGMWHHRAWGEETPLYARALCVHDTRQRRTLVWCCLDLGYVSYAMRCGVVNAIRQHLDPLFDDAYLVLTCTHTHSGPGGCSHDAMYNLVTPGFVSAHLAAVVQAAQDAIVQAWRSAQPASLGWVETAVPDTVDVAWNRSVAAYNRNPEVQPRPPSQTHLAVDRTMRVLGVRRGGRLQALLSLFGVHATCAGNTLPRYCGDNKGYAALAAERALAEGGADGPVAIFSQGTAGDVSPYYHGPGDRARRRRIRGEAEYGYARRNGGLQADAALDALASGHETALQGGLDAVLTYVDFSCVTVDPRHANGQPDARTGEPCHGVAFFGGTPVDGPGMPPVLQTLTRFVARCIKAHRLRHLDRYPEPERDYLQRLYAAQGAKDILMETGRKRVLGMPFDQLRVPGAIDPVVGELKRQVARGAIRHSAMVPTVLPLQIVRLGPLAFVCCPGEFTTIAGQRVVRTVREVLRGHEIEQVLICTYCNDYMGYVTTREEYEEQAYEGGHTIFGQWTGAAFQTCFEALARELVKPPGQRTHDTLTRPAPAPQDELRLRSDLPAPVKPGHA